LNAQKDKTIATLKNSIEVKEREIDVLQKSVGQLQASERRLRKELD
jgi:hypothetical protein